MRPLRRSITHTLSRMDVDQKLEEEEGKEEENQHRASDLVAASSGKPVSKRALSEFSNFDGASVEEGDPNSHDSKRMKLATVESPAPEDQGTQDLRASKISVTDMGPGAFPNDCSPVTLLPVGTVITLSRKTDPGKRSAQELLPLNHGRDPAAPPGHVEAVVKGGVYNCPLPPTSNPEERFAHLTQPSVEPAGGPHQHKAQSGVARPSDTGQPQVPRTVFSCDLCGFQCMEESLLTVHLLSKTHLRRQNLAARGGYVQILTKQPCAAGTKSLCPKPRTSPSPAASDHTRSPGLMGDETSSELHTHMEMSSSALSAAKTPAEEHETARSGAGSPKDQTSELGVLVTSTHLPLEAVPSAHIASRPRPERNMLMLGSSLRRRGGAFALKGQAKKRLNLLGVSKRGGVDTQRLCVKHLKSPAKSSEALPAPRHPDPSPQGVSLKTSAPEQARSILSSSDPLPERPASHQQAPGAHKVSEGTEPQFHPSNCPSPEVTLCCQACGFSSTSRRDFEGHLHHTQHQQSTSVFSCHCCPFVSPSELVLREHVKEQHSTGFLCMPCNLFFFSEGDMEEHKRTESHAHALSHPKTSPALGSDVILPTSPLGTELEGTQASLGEPGRTAKEEPSPSASRVSPGHESRHLSRPQFQCKKCFYKTRSSTVLTRHIKLRHGQDYHFLCKACNLYSLSKEGMEKHIKRSKHLENAKKNNIGLSFDECIERVWIDASDRKDDLGGGRREGYLEAGQRPEQTHPEPSVLAAQDLMPLGRAVLGEEPATPTAPEKGRPKGSTSRTCSHCGLLASSITNLTVHIRRKHSHQYSYLCKVCKYYTVTKGDMERHCATKKHKGRVDVEAQGKRGLDIVVGPEGGGLDASGRSSQAAEFACSERTHGPVGPGATVSERPAGEQGDPTRVAVESVPCPTTKVEVSSPGSEGQPPGTLDPEDLVPLEDTSPGDATGSGDHPCSHCEFHAHSAASLELHIKRKHTKEFAFYCMACDYYAVTRREMTRHAGTEKHRIKRQSYMNAPHIGATTADVSQAVLSREQQQQQISEEFQIFPDQPTGTVGSGPVAGGSVSVEVVNSQEPHASCMSCPVGVETREEGQPSREPLQQSLVKGQGTSHNELEVDSHSSSPSHQEREDLVSEKTSSIPSAQKYSCDPRVQRQVIDQGDSAGSLPTCQVMPTTGEGGAPAMSVLPGVPRDSGQLGLETCTHRGSEEQPALESEAMSLLSQHRAQVIVDDGPSVEAVVGSQEVYETVVTVDDRGQASCSLGRFDSSIIRIGSPEDSEVAEVAGEGPVGPGPGLGLQPGEPPSRESAPPLGRKRRAEGTAGEAVRIRCDDCGFLADGLSGLNVHIAMKHPSKEKHFHCLLCGKSFYTESNLHQHLASAGHLRNEQASVEELPEGGATFKCVKCTEPFDSEQSLFLHIKGQHEELLREVNKYIVEDTEQINREREENQGSVCKYCGKICRSSNSMAFLAHIRTHTGSKPFKCKICHFATAQLGDARNHVKRHLGMREYKCHVCGVAFVMKKHLNTHLLGKHGVGTPKERKFPCHLCDRSFTEKWALNNHRKLHTGEKPFKCSWPTCHYSFLTASAMKDHYRTHTGEKSFLCDLCGFAGGTRHALTKHRRQHTGEKPFKCDECNFASTTQSHLTRHKRVHTGEKPYRCPWCDYRSNCAENIRKHILHTGKHEGVKMYNCPKCEYGTNVPVEFRNHLKEQHPDIENPDLAYLHAGIVSKSYECRLKGQGAAFVETDSAFTAAALAAAGSTGSRGARGPGRGGPETLPQLIIVQGCEAELALDAAAVGGALALAGPGARLLHLTEDGRLLTTSPPTPEPPDAPTQLLLLDPAPPASQTPDTASALDALLCAVSELGAEDRAPRDVLLQLPGPPAPTPSPQEPNPGPQARAQAALRKVVQGVLQLAVCEPALAKDAVTQLILDGEGAHIIMQEADTGLDTTDTPAEVSQVVVTDELVQAMVQEAAGAFPEGATHYIVTQLPPGAHDGPAAFSQRVLEAAGAQDLLHQAASPGSEPLASMVIYTQDGAATLIQSHRDSSELQEA